MQKIKRNAVKCVHCGDVIESKSVHHFVSCSCGRCAVDGGREYLKRMGNLSDFIELCEYEKGE